MTEERKENEVIGYIGHAGAVTLDITTYRAMRHFAPARMAMGEPWAPVYRAPFRQEPTDAKAIADLARSLPAGLTVEQLAVAIWRAAEQVHGITSTIGEREAESPPPPPEEVAFVAITKAPPKILGTKSAAKRITRDRVLITGSRAFVRCSIDGTNYTVECVRDDRGTWKKHAVKVQRRSKAGALYWSPPHARDIRKARVVRYALAAVISEDRERLKNGEGKK